MTGKVGSNHYKKADELGLPKPIITEETSKKLSNAIKNRTPDFLTENAKRISTTVNRKVLEGTWHTSLARKMHINYNGVDLHGSWELAYAKYLDSNSIKWKRCKESFTYEFGGKSRKYTPRFFI